MSNTPFQFGDAVGRFRVETESLNGRSTKIIRCVAAGLLYLDRGILQETPGGMAFGSWEWWYKSPGAVSWFMQFNSLYPVTVLAPTSTTYYWLVNGTNQIRFYRDTAGAQVLLARTGDNAFTSNVWNKCYVYRKVSGEFGLYLNDQLITMVAGTNPFTDTNLLTGNYLCPYMATGDKLALGSSDGANCFVKRCKSVI